MSKPNEKDILDSIQRTLEEIKAILVLLNQEKLATIKKNLLKEGSIKTQIYDLCDGSKTAKDIATIIQKELPYVNSYLSILRREGLIRSVKKDSEIVHEQIF
jgi:transcription initiation factor IIE alpha subunit